MMGSRPWAKGEGTARGWGVGLWGQGVLTLKKEEVNQYKWFNKIFFKNMYWAPTVCQAPCWAQVIEHWRKHDSLEDRQKQMIVNIVCKVLQKIDSEHSRQALYGHCRLRWGRKFKLRCEGQVGEGWTEGPEQSVHCRNSTREVEGREGERAGFVLGPKKSPACWSRERKGRISWVEAGAVPNHSQPFKSHEGFGAGRDWKGDVKRF